MFRKINVKQIGLINAFIAIISIVILPAWSNAAVYSLRIDSRQISNHSIEGSKYGSYEILKGVVFFQLDPDDPANSMITDLRHAPLNTQGMIEFSAEFELHKPLDAQAGNHKLIYFASNRGRKIGSGFFSVYLDYNWLYSKGYSYVWCGWNADVPPDSSLLNIFLPIASKNGKPIQGEVYSELISFSNDTVNSMPIVWGNSLAYPPIDLDDPSARLSMRQYRNDEPIIIDRNQWRFASFESEHLIPDSMSVYLEDGFIPGFLYELVYTAKNSMLSGLGMAAIRDLVSFLRYESSDINENPNPLYAFIDHTLAWGHSQSGRLLNHFVYKNFNSDEEGRIVLDGVMCNCAGAGKGMFNSRFAQTTRHGSHHEDHLYPVDFFPFAGIPQYDPVTGKTGDAFKWARESACMPKMIYLNSSTDYWTRAASLLHTDVEGTNDLQIAEDIRIYLVSGIAHTDNKMAIPGRALLIALDDWVSSGIDPPESKVPKISDATLVNINEWNDRFPDIPDLIKPESYYNPYVLDMGKRWDSLGIADKVPPEILGRYVCLVPQVDSNGNEISGIQLADVEVCLATYTGWRMRNPSFSNSLQRNNGQVWPLPYSTESNHEGDPRLPISSKYKSGSEYLDQYDRSLQKLTDQGFLLNEDQAWLLEKARLRSRIIPDLRPIDELALEFGADSAFNYFIKLWQAELAWITFTGSPNNLRDGINTKGYELMIANEPQSAKELFSLNTMIFDNYANGWDSLAECFYLMNKPGKALTCYKKVLELQPSNDRARTMIDQIEREINQTNPEP